MEWDAHRLLRYDSQTQQWVQFIDEPLTASAAWDVQLDEEAGEKHKTGYVNFKRVIWHESFRIILDPICPFSHSDYEEQCCMSLIRGANGLFPCPVCMIPKGQLSNYAVVFPKRTGQEAQRILREALALKNQSAREAILQQWSLRPVQNAFLELAHSDPYQALSFDRLHAFHSGLFGHHYWTEFKKHVQNVSNEAVKLIDAQYNLIPRWSGLIHFNEVMGISFTDGSKYEDISKNILFASHNVLTSTVSPAGYQLLCTLRPYLEEDTYIGLPMHTQWTLEDGRFAQAAHCDQLEEYKRLTAEMEDSKNWDFPKAHTHMHAFDDIEAKGVSQNFNTKPNEKMHRPFKEAYRLRTNHRNVASQLLDIDHYCYAMGHMRAEIDLLKPSKETPEGDGHSPPAESIGGGHFSLAFNGFGRRLGDFLIKSYTAHNLPLPGGTSVTFPPNSKITEYRLLQVNYESLADWRQDTDLLCCNPMFFGHPCYDCVMVKGVGGKDFFARLLFMFTCSVNGTTEPLALIQPYGTLPGPISRKDIDLGFYRLRESRRKPFEFISIHSVICGALLIPDFAKLGNYLVHDFVDSDMFLHMKALRGLSE
ncbi:hypothetical protein NUW54_g3829 [Trametes sanguinea]|uniref:Uncharacterized protein n=1 Tax=Trametes sanguinea TaxID=158606 RepID=A0ACC1Q1S8_9APHY|nr:hypothetical protein NUW54_g3829 [Trametes sanguinea]